MGVFFSPLNFFRLQLGPKRALESITLPTGVNRIEWDAFEGCIIILIGHQLVAN